MTNHTSSLRLGPVMITVSGLVLSESDRQRLQHPLVGGVVLFGHNFESRKQVTRLCGEIRAARSPRLLIAVDHEGGRVQRFRKGFTEIPPMRDLGAMWEFDVLGACKRATELGVIIGRELGECGVDLSFSPVLDLDHGLGGVIGDRALHSDPRVVSLLARCLTHGLLLSGMANCGKHFPGHGFAHADSHQTLPVDERTLDGLLAADAAPYATMGETLTAVMAAHVVYPKVDTKPAGFSRRWLHDLLRGQINFGGLVFSDDLCMQAAATAGSISQRTRAALSAGCDMVLVCDPGLADELLGQLSWKPGPHFDRRLRRLFLRTAAQP